MTRLVVSFNRHFFGLALLATAVGTALLVSVESTAIRTALAMGVGLALYFMIASVVATFITYDASDLYKLRWWPARCLGRPPSAGVLVHAGFDAASSSVRANYPQMRLGILNFFEAGTTTEASIRRAHQQNPLTDLEERISPVAWPEESRSQDVVFILNTAHELRKLDQRIAFFMEAKRGLKDGGKIIVIEQLRDFVNFACFGVAAYHFLSRGTWLRSFTGAGLKVADEFRITPFLRAFVLQAV
jgi:hypothetical protein